jgi:hypothetical protein
MVQGLSRESEDPEVKPTVPNMTRAGLVFGELRVFMRTDGQFAVFDKRKPLAEQSVGVFGRADDAIKEAKRLAALDGPAAAKAPKIDTDAEAFAGMKRAMENGFAPHEPALTPLELAREELVIAKACEIAKDAMTRELERPITFRSEDVEIVDDHTVRLIPSTGAGFDAFNRMIEQDREDDALQLLESTVVTKNGEEIKGEIFSRPDCPRCGVGFCELDCSCACHLEELPR